MHNVHPLIRNALRAVEPPIDPPEPIEPEVTFEDLVQDYRDRITAEIERRSNKLVVHGRAYDLGNELKECLMSEDVVSLAFGAHALRPVDRVLGDEAIQRAINELAESFARDDIARGRVA